MPDESAALLRDLHRLLYDDQRPARERLLALIRTLDLAGGDAVRAGESEAERVVYLALARATIALAPLTTPTGESPLPTVDATARAARSFVAAPTEANETAFFDAATSSYPFGPGDGCLAVEELGGHGARGAGDGGAGFVWQVAHIAGPERVLEALQRELEAWLIENDERAP